MNLGFESPWQENIDDQNGLEANQKLDFVKKDFLWQL